MSTDNNTFKILTLGESGVGKTAILRRYVENKFEKHHLATIGIDYQSKTIKIKNKEIKLKIWDTAGQERYLNLASHLYKGADGIMLVYDITDEYSFSKITDWMEQINSNLSKNEIGLTKKLIGKKTVSFYCIDCLAEYLEVTTEELEAKVNCYPSSRQLKK